MPLDGFFIDVVLAIVVTLVTLAADWIARSLMSYTSSHQEIKNIVSSSTNPDEAYEEVKEEIERFYSSKNKQVVWGSELAAITFSLDIAILSLWVTNPHYFPFFSRFNDVGISRELPVWLVALAIHFVILLVSIGFKHAHMEKNEIVNHNEIRSRGIFKWLSRQRAMVLSNTLGFLSLLSAFIIIANSI